MKKILVLMMVAIFMALLFASCQKSAQNTDGTQSEAAEESTQIEQSEKTPQQLSDAIVSARIDEQNDAFAVMAGSKEETATYLHNPMQTPQEGIDSEVAGLKQITGIDYDSCDTYAVSVSLMNIHAYAVGIFYPAEGSEEAVEASLQSYIAAKQLEFENYLPEQYEIAKNAVLQTTADGAFILVIDENAKSTADAIEANLSA